MAGEVELVEVGDEADLEELALDLAGKLDEGVSLVLRGPPKRVRDLMIILRKYGANWLRVVYAPPWEDPEKYLFYARYLEAAGRAPYRVTGEKPLKRRILLSRMAKASFDYMDAPIVDSRCSTLKHCQLCVESCPQGAILPGKPVRIDLERCTECGACVNSCPAGFLWPPGISLYGLSKLLEGSEELVLAPLSRLHEAREGTVLRSQEGAAPLVVVLEALGRGIRLSGIGMELLDPYLEELDSLPKGDGRAVEVRRFNDHASREASAVASMLQDSDEWIPLDHLNFFRVEVSEECTLCGACARACPSDALKVVEEGGVLRLEFSHQLCVGCGTCGEICPEGAVKISRSLNPHLLRSGEFIELTRDEIARCRGCGAPLEGSVRMLERLEERIRARSGDKYAKMVWYCRDCKATMLLEGAP